VEERPERVVADLAVEGLFFLDAHEDRLAALGRYPPLRFLLKPARHSDPGPAHPDVLAAGAAESGHEPAGAGLDPEALLLDRERNREPVTRDDEVAYGCR